MINTQKRSIEKYEPRGVIRRSGQEFEVKEGVCR